MIFQNLRRIRLISLIEKYHLIFLIVGGLIYATMIPYGVQTAEILGSDLRVDNINDDEEIASFSSLKNNILIVVDGDNNIISDEVKSWIEIELFTEIRASSVARSTLANEAKPIHVFNQFSEILINYFSNLFTITKFANVTSFVLLNGTRELINNFQILKENSTDNYAELALEITYEEVEYTLNNVINAFFIEDLALDILNKTKSFLVQNSESLDLYNLLLEDWKTNIDNWISGLIEPQFRDILLQFVNKITNETNWDEQFITSSVAEIIFGTQEQLAIDFIIDNFGGGSAIYYISKAQEKLIPFIRGTYTPYGLTQNTNDLLRSTLANSENGSEITSIIIQYRLESGISKSELNDIFNFFTNKISKMSQNEFSYDLAIMSLLNYQKERGEILNEEFHRLDILTIIIVFFILLFWLKDIKLILVSLSLAWTTTQTAKGLLVYFVPDSIVLVDVSVSIGSSLLFGAALNYCIFFAFRFREERLTNDHQTAVINSTKTAVHSIYISGIAIFLTFLPLTTSSLGMIVGLTYIATAGILIELVLLGFLLPSLYLNLEGFFKSINFQDINTVKMRGLNVNYQNYKKYLLLGIILFIISLSVVIFSETNLSAEDYIGDEGQTAAATQIFADHYPANYFSKILVKIHFLSLSNTTLTKLQFDQVSLLSTSIIQTSRVNKVLSYSHPFGDEVNFNQTINLIEEYTFSLVRNQLFSLQDNETYVIVYLGDSPDSITALRATEKIIDLVKQFEKSNDNIVGIGLSGFTLSNLSFEKSVTSELASQITLALILLTLFLWYQFRSLSVPIRLELTIIVGSIYALAIGTLIWSSVFNNPINLVINTTAIVVLLGLGVDFDIYIYTRIEEELKNGREYLDAINIALEKSGPAIRTSGIAMAVSFLSLTTGSIILTKQFGLITFIAIVIDIYFVRTILVPAILLLRHKKN
ncbi:MAG: putative membrane protein YdgH [Candidatus Heimdallarchaeota archaeon LC_2]|nr:MAG: putative membrane protein YdgH [Candidatus Heimdallarchaeota archaeon LC_2]